MAHWECFSDSEYGGRSSAALSLVDGGATDAEPPSPSTSGSSAVDAPGATPSGGGGAPRSPTPAADAVFPSRGVVSGGGAPRRGRAGPGDHFPAPPSSFAAFHGELSSEIPEGVSRRLRRSGFVGARTRDLPAGAFFPLDDMDTLVLHVRPDGRKYLVNLRTESSFSGTRERPDIWQAFLGAPRGGAWATVPLPLAAFRLTAHGRVVDAPAQLDPSRVIGLGFSLAGDGEREPDGPYRLELASAWAERRAGPEIAAGFRPPQPPLAL